MTNKLPDVKMSDLKFPAMKMPHMWLPEGLWSWTRHKKKDERK